MIDRQGPVTFRSVWQKIGRTVSGWLVPQPLICPCCAKKWSSEAMANPLNICKKCYDAIPWITTVKCTTCGRHETCYDCARRTGTKFVCNRSAVHYDETMKSWLAMFKYRGNEKMYGLFVTMLGAAYEQLIRELTFRSAAADQPAKLDCITYTPLSDERLRERGFNQAELLARGLGFTYRVPVVPLLSRVHHTEKQSYKTRAERINDLHGAFAFRAQEEGVLLRDLRKKSLSDPLQIGIVDDVYTTGSTLNECSKMITGHMDAEVYGITWAR